MPAPAAVAVHDDFSAGQSGVALRSADDETAGRVDEKLGRAVEHGFRQHFADDLFDAELFDLGVLDVLGVLRRDDDVGNADWFPVIVNDGDL